MGAWEDNSNQENYWSLIAQKMERKSNNRGIQFSVSIYSIQTNQVVSHQSLFELIKAHTIVFHELN